MTKTGGMGRKARLAGRGMLLAAVLPAAGLHLFFAPAAARPAVPSAGQLTGPADVLSLSVRERAEVMKGKVVLRTLPNPGRKGRTYEAIGILQGSLDEAFAIVTDFAGYPEFMPNVGSLKICEETEACRIVEVKLHLPFGVKKQYRLNYSWSRDDSGFAVTWEKLPWPELKSSRTVVDTSGFWSISKFEDGGLLAVYHVYTDPGHVPLGLTGIAQGVAKGKIPDVIIKVRERIRSVFPPG